MGVQIRTCMVKPVDPLLRHRLHAFDGPNVVGLAIVVPCVDFDKVHHGSVPDRAFPALGEEPVVASVDEVLVIRILAVVLFVTNFDVNFNRRS